MIQNNQFDIVIPAHSKDKKILQYCIKYARKNIIGARNIIVISKENLIDDKLIIWAKSLDRELEIYWFDEAKFPFSYQELCEIKGYNDIGWYYQQLLKIYSVITIDNILDNILILDSDTVFYKKTPFFNKNFLPLYNISKDKNLDRSIFHQESLQHIKTLLPELENTIKPSQINFCNKFSDNSFFGDEVNASIHKEQQNESTIKFEAENRTYNSPIINPEIFDISAVCHHMIFQKHIIIDLINKVENAYYQKNQQKKSFYEIFLITGKGNVSEYNLYFYFINLYYQNQFETRLLKYKNTVKFYPKLENIRKKYSYCSYHSYMKKESNFIKNIIRNSKIANKINKIFTIYDWQIGFIDCNIADLIKIIEQKKTIYPDIQFSSSQEARFFNADPFYFKYKNQDLIIYEKYCRIRRRGLIAIAKIGFEEIRKEENNQSDSSGNTRKYKIYDEKIIFDNKKHLSYPYIFSHQEAFYLLLEEHKIKELNLYRLDCEYDNNFQLTKIKNIFANLAIIDASLLFHNDRFWLFYHLQHNSEEALYLTSSNDLFGDFKHNDNNLIKNDKKSARSAGNFIKIDNQIYRPSQNCIDGYGSSIVINKITNLDISNYREEFFGEIIPSKKSIFNKGNHHLSFSERFVIIDGKREFFSLKKPIYSIYSKIIRLWNR